MSDQGVFELHEGTLPIDVPGVWEDKTIHVLRMPGHGHSTASLVVTRETLPLGMDVQGYVQSELKRLATTLPAFSERGRVPITWSDVAGEAVMARWLSREGSVDQILAARPGEAGQVLVFTATHPTPMPSESYTALMTAISGFRPRARQPAMSQ